MATKKKLDAEAILRDLERMRKSIPYLDEVPASRPTEDGRTRGTGGLQPRTAEEFEWLAVADGLESLANDLSATIRRKEAEAVERAL